MSTKAVSVESAGRRRFLQLGTGSARPGGWSETPVSSARGTIARIEAHCLALNRIECRVCGERCDASAIVIAPSPAPGAFASPRIDASRCRGCGECARACPLSAIGMVPANLEVQA
ncbi:MAG: 4Fe-4S dicluster domain-containing protein [Burkholderiales bacterium]|nr:4Fe-4S dicluster domain-containing protein [Burkholderiales bacterium]